MISSHRNHFLAQPDQVAAHAALVATNSFQTSLNAALGEYSRKCSQDAGPDAGYWKSRGAFEFAEVFCNLSAPVTETTHRDPDNLE